MTEKLPISIQVSDSLIEQIKNITAISNKLEAQLNFHTMTANWYEDEENILLINFYLLAVDEFNDKAEQDTEINKEFLADDVFMLLSANKFIDCNLTITANEQLLLQQTPKILSGYLGKKLTKVLNLIAKNQGLDKI